MVSEALLELFWAQLSPPSLGPLRALDLETSARVVARLRAHVEAARAAWPRLTHHDEAFIVALARGAAGATPEAALRDLHAADLLLAVACARRDPTALSLLEGRFLVRLRPLVRRLSPKSSQEDLLQLVRQRILVPVSELAPPRIAAYLGKGPLEGWLRATALRVLLNSRSSRSADAGVAGREALVEALTTTPELHVVRQQHHAALRDAIEAAVASLTPADRALLKLNALERVSIDRLAELHGIGRSSVARRLAAIRGAVLEETRVALRSRLRLSSAQVSSLLRGALSGANVSLERLLSA